MDTLTLQIYRDVSEKLSFAAVAKIRGINASSVSRSIGALEAELGVRLVHRTTRKMALTESGVRFLRHAIRILDAVEEARDQARDTHSKPAGCVRLAASTAFGEHMIVPHLLEFRRQFPLIQLDLHLNDAQIDLAASGIDLAIRLGDRLEGEFVCSRLFATRYLVCASPAYLESAPPLLLPADLSQHRCLLFTLPDFRSSWRWREPGGETLEVPVAGDLAMSSATSLLAAARQGLGPALLADWLVRKDLTSGTLIDVFPDLNVTATSYDTAAWLIYPDREYVPNRVRVLIAFLRQVFGNMQLSNNSRGRI